MLLRSFAAHPFRFRMFLLLFAWIVVFSLSSADLFDLQDEVGRSLTDLQLVLESEFEEVRDEAAPLRIELEHSVESLSIQPALFHVVGLSSHQGTLSTHGLLSRLSVYRV